MRVQVYFGSGFDSLGFTASVFGFWFSNLSSILGTLGPFWAPKSINKDYLDPYRADGFRY